jgi:hypothetical protein
VTVTKYAPLAPGATVNDPETTPPDTEQTEFEISVGMEGDDEIEHVVSPAAKLELEMTTELPAPPEEGESKIPPVLRKLADTAPSELGKVTVYDPGLAAAATVKLPVIWKVAAEILQDTADNSPGGELNSVAAQPAPASAAPNPEPVMETGVEDGPLEGVSVILGVTANVPVPMPPTPLVTRTVQVPPWAVALTMKEAVRAPAALIVHVGEGAPAKRFDPGGAVIAHGPASAEVKVPVTLTGPAPVLPEDGEIVSVTGTPFVKLVEAVSAVVAPSTVIVYKPLETTALTVKVPTTVPLPGAGLSVQVVADDGGVSNVGSKFAGVETI